MPIEMSCPRGHKLQVSEAHVGKEVRCPTCGVAFMATDPGAPATARPQPPGLPPGGAGMSALRDRLRLGPGGSLSALNAGRPVMMLGLLLVLLARGCDTVGHRGVERAAARLTLAQNQFDDEYKTRQIALQQDIEAIDDQIDKLREKSDRTEADNTKMEDLRKDRSKAEEKISVLGREQQEKRASLQRTTWRRLEIAARDAQTENQMSAYWREMVFLFGSILLGFGLLAVSWTAEGAERWICLIMLAIITFSLYVGGIAWIGGIPGR